MTDYKRPSETTVDKNKGEAMINKVLSSIRRIGGESSFEGYLKGLHRHSSAPGKQQVSAIAIGWQSVELARATIGTVAVAVFQAVDLKWCHCLRFPPG